MKILKESVRTSPPKFSVQRIAQSLALGLSVLLSATQAVGQTEKKITYPVSVQIERSATSSTPATPAFKAPEPVIRAIEEASAKPPPVRKPVTKPSVAQKPNAKPAKATSANKAKPASKATAVKKTTTTKSTTKTVSKTPSAATAKKPLTPTKPADNYAEKIQPASITPANVREAIPVDGYQEVHLNAETSAIKTAIAPVAATTLASVVTDMDEEQMLAESLSEERENFVQEPVAVAPAVVPSTIPVAVKNLPLPMGEPREAFVRDFKQYVETKIVPGAPGVALAVIAEGKIKVLQTYGMKRVGTNSPMNADTTFRLASVSKSFGATAAAMLVNDGLLRWDTKVRTMLPGVEFSNPRYGDQITVQNILSQSTGLPTQTNSNFIEEGFPFDEVVRRLRYVNFVCPPGKCYNYQNVTYSLISNIVLKKTGLTYEQFLENKLFQPLGMRTATVGFAGYNANGNYAEPHIPTRKGWAPTTVTEHYYRVNPAAGVNASISDMARWVLAHMGQNPTVLPPAVLSAVHAKVTRNTPAQNHYGSREGVTDSHYGLGWRVFDYRGDKNFVHHGGGVKGFRSEVVFNSELKIGMIILTNGPRLSGSIIFDFLDAYEDEKRGERKVAAAVPKKKNKGR